MSVKSFDEYFDGYKNYDNGGELDQLIVADAKKVYETLKTPEEIDQFRKGNCKKRVEGLDDDHTAFSFASVCSVAYKYATYAQKHVENTVANNKLANVRNKLASKNDEMPGTNIKDVNDKVKIKPLFPKKFEKGGR